MVRPHRHRPVVCPHHRRPNANHRLSSQCWPPHTHTCPRCLPPTTPHPHPHLHPPLQLPLSLLRAAQSHPMLVELKNGDTYNGHLVSCDNYMNIALKDVICTSKVRAAAARGVL